MVNLLAFAPVYRLVSRRNYHYDDYDSKFSGVLDAYRIPKMVLPRLRVSLNASNVNIAIHHFPGISRGVSEVVTKRD